MGHQVVDGDVAGAVVESVQRPGSFFQHLQIGELWSPFGDRVVELEFAFLHQHQDGHGGDRLGHRGDAEHGVAGHGLAGDDVAVAERIELDDLALAPDQGDEAGKVACFDHALEGTRDAIEGRLIKLRGTDIWGVHGFSSVSCLLRVLT